MSYGVGHRFSSDLALLWLWRRPAAAAPIGPLSWEPPYALGAALEKTKRQKKKKMLSCGTSSHGWQMGLIPQGNLENLAEYTLQNYPAQGVRELGYLCTCSAESEVEDSQGQGQMS